MSYPLTRTRVRALVAAFVVLLLALGFVVHSTAPADAAAKPNGYAKIALHNTSGGEITVTWKKTTNVKKYVIETSTKADMSGDVSRYTVSKKATSKVIPHAKYAGASSGNYTFVRIYAYKTDHVAHSKIVKIRVTPVKPVSSAKITVATFNVRTADSPQVSGQTWDKRKKLVVKEIQKSGAAVVAIQEAGKIHVVGGKKVVQISELLSQLKKVKSSWRAVSTAVYCHDAHPTACEGKQDSRILYDSSKVSLSKNSTLGATNGRIDVAYLARNSAGRWFPWAQFTQKSSGRTFAVISAHEENGNDVSKADKAKKAHTNVRLKQTASIVALSKKLASTHQQVIVAGDMNSNLYTWPSNVVQRAFLKAGFYDAYSTKKNINAYHVTFNGFSTSKSSASRTDYIFTYGGAKGSYEYKNQLQKKAKPMASDHNLQWAILPI